MADPVLPKLIGAVVAKVLHRVIVAAEKAINWPQYCAQLKGLLESLRPMVSEIISQEKRDPANISLAVRNWLQELHTCLEHAETVLLQCADPKQGRDPFARYGSGQKLEKTTALIKDLLQTRVPLSTMAVVMQQKADFSQHIEAVDVAYNDLRQQMAQLSLSMEAQKCMLSEALNKDHAFYAMKNGADRLLAIAHDATAAANYPSVNSQSSSSNNEAWETQPRNQNLASLYHSTLRST